jgi:hypothetical protein
MRDRIRGAESQGREKGIKIGIKIGIKQVKAVIEQDSIVIARQLLDKGLDVAFIKKLLKLNRSKFQ